MSSGDCIANCEQLVADLYTFRDNYFLENGIDNASNKENDVLKKMQVSSESQYCRQPLLWTCAIL